MTQSSTEAAVARSTAPLRTYRTHHPQPARTTGSLSLAQARRIALRAQGLDRARRERPNPPGIRQLQQVIDRLGVIQIDSVNVLARAHEMVLFSRLGPYDRTILERASGKAPRRLVEAWAHEQSYIATDTYPLLGWRRRGYPYDAWTLIRDAPAKYGPLIRDVRDLLAAEGAMTSAQVHMRVQAEHPRNPGEWGWDWTVARRVLEYLFFVGELSSAYRTDLFERVYDLSERVIPDKVLNAPQPADDDAVRTLIDTAARAHGIASSACLLDYFRIRPAMGLPAIRDLVEEGVLAPVTVEGWSRPVYLHRDADLPRRATGSMLLSPFDPLMFERQRVEDLFGLYYRLEIYVPRSQRMYGYYVLPFLHEDRLAALLDLKADRTDKVLQVRAAHLTLPVRPGTKIGTELTGDVAEMLADLVDELWLLAEWLDLEHLQQVYDNGFRGDLGFLLDRALKRW